MFRKINTDLNEAELSGLLVQFRKFLAFKSDAKILNLNFSTVKQEKFEGAELIVLAFIEISEFVSGGNLENLDFFSLFVPALRLLQYLISKCPDICTTKLFNCLSGVLASISRPDQICPIDLCVMIGETLLGIVRVCQKDLFFMQSSFEFFLKYLDQKEIFQKIVQLQESGLSEIPQQMSLNYLGYILTIIYSYTVYTNITLDFQSLFPFFTNALSNLHTPENYLETTLTTAYNFTLVLKTLQHSQISESELLKTLQISSEKIKELFISSAEIFFSIEPSRYLGTFQKDSSLLAQLFETMLNLLIKTGAALDIVVIVMFRQVCRDIAEYKVLQVKSGVDSKLKGFILEFLYIYFFNGYREVEIDKETCLEILVFDKLLFVNNDEEVNEIWGNIWRKISLKSDCKVVIEAIVQNVRLHIGDLEYLTWINSWFESINEKGEIILKTLAKIGILKEFLLIMPNAQGNAQYILYQITIFFFNFFEVPGPGEIFEVIINKLLPLKGDFEQYSETWVSKLLICQIVSISSSFVEFFSKKNNGKVVMCLVNSILKSLQDFNSKKHVRKVLVGKGLLKVLGNVLVGIDRDSAVVVWVKCFECLEVILDNNFEKETCGFNFSVAVHAIRLDFYKDMRKEIIEKTLKSVKHIVLHKDYSGFKTPSGLSLLFEYICSTGISKTQFLLVKLKKILQNSLNFNQSINSNLLNVFFHHFTNPDFAELIQKPYEKIISKMISRHINYCDFSKIISLIINLRSTDRRYSLMNILYNSLEPSEIAKSVSSYFYFMNKGFLSLASANNSWLLNKEFSIVLWVFPDLAKSCVVFNVLCSNNYIDLLIDKGEIVLKIGGSNLATGINLKKEEWSLIAINFKFTKVAKMIKSNKITIVVNSQKSKFRDLNKLNFSQKTSIKNISLNASEKDFTGKIAFFYIFRRRVKKFHLAILESQSESFSLLPNQYSSIEDSKNYQDLQTNLIVGLTTSSVNILPQTVLEITCEIYNISSIYQVIQAYDPKRFLFEIFEASKDQEETLTQTYEIVLRIVLGAKFIPLINLDFIRLLGTLMNSKELTERINELYVMIISSCPENLAKALIEIYIQNNFSGKNKHISTVTKLFKDLIPFSRESFYKFCMILQGFDRASTKALLVLYLGEDSEEKVHKFSDVLICLLKADRITQIECLLEILEDFLYTFGNFTPIQTVLLDILKKIDRASIQISILKIFCLNEKYTDENALDVEQVKILMFLIDEMMPLKIEFSMINAIITYEFRQKSYLETMKICLIDIIMKRLGFIHDSESLGLIQKFVYKNKANVMKWIHDRDIFPEWLIRFHQNTTAAGVASQFTVYIFTIAAEKENFEKMKFFFKEFENIDYFIEIFQNLKTVDKEIVFELLTVLKGFSRNYFQENMEKFIQALKLFLRQDILDLFSESMSITKVLGKTPKTPTKNVSKRRSKYKFILVEYLQFLMNSLSIYSNSPDFINILHNLLKHNNFMYFCKYSNLPNNPDKKQCELLVSVYVFTELSQIFYDKNMKITEFLNQFIQKSRCFHKILKFFQSKHNKEVLKEFDKLPINTAILGSKSELEPYYDFIKVDSKSSKNPSEYLQYEPLIRYISDIDIDFIQNPRPPVEILDTADWEVVYEKLLTIVKNFKNATYRDSINVIDPRNSVKFNSSSQDHYKILLEFMDNSWLINLQQAKKKFHNKQQYDLVKLSNSLSFIDFVLQDLPSNEKKIRQVYDKFYRWPLFLAKNPKKIKADLLAKLHESEDEILSTETNSFTTSVNAKYSDKIIYKCPIELIKVQGSYFGQLEICENYLELKFSGELKPENCYFGSALSFSKQRKISCKIWYLDEVSEVVPRRFIHKHSAIEAVLYNGKSYFLNFFEEKIRAVVLEKIGSIGKVKVWDQKSLKVYAENCMNDWRKRLISNFEYLMIVNRLGGRSNNDLSQYPVFPWVLSDYSSEKLVVTDKEKYRKFEFPIGAQTENMQSDARNKFKMWSEFDIQPYHYGSHYSNSGIVTHYLLRIEPYTTQAKQIQGGCFDIADRLFFSLELAWKSCSSTSGDVKELVPELFFQYFSLENYSKFDYGCSQTGLHIIHVNTPNWAVSRWDFLKKHRMCLESEIVSSEIHNWIDLIFGFKQSGKNAFDALNLYCPTTYEESFLKMSETKSPNENDLDVEQAYHFGQIPICVFTKPHGKREVVGMMNVFENCLEKKYRFKKMHMKNSTDGSAHKIFVSEKKLILVKSLETEVWLVRYNLTEVKYLENQEILLEFVNKTEARGWVNMNDLCKPMDFSYQSSSFALFRSKYLISALHPSRCVMVHTLKGKFLISLKFHTDIVTQVACTPDFLFSASVDSTIASWKVSANLVFSHYLTYFGHSSAITQLHPIDSYSLLISASIQGLILIHDIREQACLKKIAGETISIAVSELGIIAVCNEKSVRFYGVNGETITNNEVETPAKMIKFNANGDYCIEVYENFIKFRDPTNKNQKYQLNLDRVKDLIVHPCEKAIFMCRDKKKNKNSIYIIKQQLK